MDQNCLIALGWDLNPRQHGDISQNPPFSVFVEMKIIEIFTLIKISMV